MIKALTFDLDDTLWDIWPVVERAEVLLHDWLAARYPRISERFTPLQLRDLCEEIAAARPAIAHDRTRLRKDALQLAASRAGYAEFDAESAFAVFFAARNAVELFAEAVSYTHLDVYKRQPLSLDGARVSSGDRP